MKGISAIIASVLLIAFTVAVGGILSVWSTTLTTTQTQTVGNQTGGQIVCSPAIIIDQVNLPSINTVGLLGVAGLGALNVTFHNAGNQPITNVNVDVRNGSSMVSSLYGTLAGGDSGWKSVNGILGNITDSVRVRGLCTNSIVVSDDCNPSKKCWKT
jgi:flagellin-like protein